MNLQQLYWRSIWPILSKLNGHRAIYRQIGEVGGFRPSDKVLELGSGRWPYFKTLPQVEKIFVTDSDPRTVARCMKNAGRVENAVFLPARVEELRFSDNTFDKVFSVNCALCPEETNRVLRPGGIFIYAIGYGGGRSSICFNTHFFRHAAVPALEEAFSSVREAEIDGAMAAIAMK